MYIELINNTDTPQLMMRDKTSADIREAPICCNKQIANDFDDLITLMG